MLQRNSRGAAPTEDEWYWQFNCVAVCRSTSTTVWRSALAQEGNAEKKKKKNINTKERVKSFTFPLTRPTPTYLTSYSICKQKGENWKWFYFCKRWTRENFHSTYPHKVYKLNNHTAESNLWLISGTVWVFDLSSMTYLQSLRDLPSPQLESNMQKIESDPSKTKIYPTWQSSNCIVGQMAVL